ncbi:multisite-specific tRNA:(cytosine-C(5))-methyltransferase-like [Culex quinquefasciatus]|uniref:multisite-specific tRNA:(cytosine-C(5))-methyltransferase-like n=1 Tax=Culex quinquefasciatus TaxID=7176 RepID=UPI0018E2F8D6|nr:multisite-specific tRNA:(cytosine-C(5))-methyltransferase-like [Culex quinquefasciatus]
MLAEPERKRSRAADGDGQAMPCSDALPGMTDHQGHASPRKLPHRLPTAYAPAPAPEDMVKFNLERCNLALLHQQNTGRLFIVLFEKKKKLLSEVLPVRTNLNQGQTVLFRQAHVKNRQRKTSESSFFFFSNRTMKSLPVFCWWRRARLQRSRLNLTMSSGAGAGA